ncbi:hypothetical protein FKM82_021149 [Ascaphus truei]
MCKRSASPPHCLGHNGEYPGTNLDNFIGVRYHLIKTLYVLSLNVVHMALLAAAVTIPGHSSSSKVAQGPLPTVMSLNFFEYDTPEQTTRPYSREISPLVSVFSIQSLSKFVNWGRGLNML